MKILARILIKGEVQGVGYRYFVRRLALNMGLTGWVRNLYNGDVEIEVEGEKEKLDEFIKKIRSEHPWAIITDINIKYEKDLKNYSRFDIKF